MSIFKSVPGYALEKFLNHGSRELRTKLSDPEESFGEIAAELEDIKLEDIHRLQTWATQESVTWEHGNLHGDNETKAGLTSMIRKKSGGYLQRHFANRIYFNTNEPKDAIPISYSFEAIKEEKTAISNMLYKINVSDDIITKKFCAMVTHLDRKPDQAESYCEPPEVIRRKEYQRCLLRNFIRLEDTKKAKQVLVIERCFLHLHNLGSDFRKTHLTSCVGNRLFKKKGSTTIYILVNMSYHVIAGARIHSLETRIRNIVGLISDLKLLRHMGVIDEKRYTSEFGIFKSCAIEYEGLNGNYDNPDVCFEGFLKIS